MSITQLTIAAETEALLSTISQTRSIPQGQVVVDAVAAYANQLLLNSDVLPDGSSNTRDATFGLWKDRDDLPDFDEHRRAWDRDVWRDGE